VHRGACPAGGCNFGEDPDRSAKYAQPIWDPELYSDVLRILVIGGGVGEMPPAFARLTPARAAWEDRRVVHLLYGEGDGAIQLRLRWLDGAGAVCIAAELGVDVRLGDASRATARLARFQASGRVDPVPDPRSRRFQLILQALDGSLAGLSHREIAEISVGRERVEADWNHPGGHLRDRVRRAVRRGRFLMNGGYLQLLR
jgi:hypothetical protein